MMPGTHFSKSTVQNQINLQNAKKHKKKFLPIFINCNQIDTGIILDSSCFKYTNYFLFDIGRNFADGIN